MPRGGFQRGEPHCSGYRQPEREKRRKRGPSIDPPGYDAGKKIKGKKRHILVDTQGLLIHAVVHAADIQDREGGALIMATMFGMYPFLLKLYADGGYQGPVFRRAVTKIMTQEPLAKLRLHAKFFILRGNKSRLPRPRRAWCFRNESPAESGRGHASTRDAIKHLGSRSMVSFPDATGRDRAAHGTTPAAGGRA